MFRVWEVPRNENLIQKSSHQASDKRGHQRDPEPVVVTPEGREQYQISYSYLFYDTNDSNFFSQMLTSRCLLVACITSNIRMN